MALSLKARPDGFGYIYGIYVDAAGQHWRVDIMPPVAAWRGDMKMSAPYGPDASDWVVWLDGEELCRCRKVDELETRLQIATRSRPGE